MTIPAAQYLRMSTEHQQYSICNQMQFIAEYAEARGFTIVKTFEDPGKSGLCLKSRPALRHLLNEVTSGSAEFKAILVYDVSRRGRFQDVDESAHYEFLCRSAGIPIHYCAEQFINQGSMESAILKTLKCAIAAEFSRELGEKVTGATLIGAVQCTANEPSTGIASDASHFRNAPVKNVAHSN